MHVCDSNCDRNVRLQPRVCRCTIQRKCGGFAARECGEGERYLSAGYDAGAGSGNVRMAVAASAAAEAEAAEATEPGVKAAGEVEAADDAFADLPSVKWGTFKRLALLKVAP